MYLVIFSCNNDYSISVSSNVHTLVVLIRHIPSHGGNYCFMHISC